MSSSKYSAWERHLDTIGDELSRLAIACELRLRDPGVIDRILKDDASVCGRNNPAGFRKLRFLVTATYGSLNKAIDRIGPEETRLIADAIIARMERKRAAGRGASNMGDDGSSR